jgi:hypothetical protein
MMIALLQPVPLSKGDRPEMAPFGLTLFGDGGDDELPDRLEPFKAKGNDSAFEILIDGSLTKLYNDANAKSKEQRAIRVACKTLIGGIETPNPLLPGEQVFAQWYEKLWDQRQANCKGVASAWE